MHLSNCLKNKRNANYTSVATEMVTILHFFNIPNEDD